MGGWKERLFTGWAVSGVEELEQHHLGSKSKEVETMKKFLMALAVLAIASAPALAGPNAGGTLVVHDTGLAWTSDAGGSFPSPAPACGGVDNSIDLDAVMVWKVYAAFPETSSPRLKALSWGTASTVNVVVNESGLPGANDFEITQGSWPTTGSIGQSFFDTQTATMVECYWFGGYAYGGPQSFTTVAHAVQTSVFVDDSTPAQEDAIANFSSLGFGAAGVTNCPSAPLPGACCFADGSCQMLLADACLAAGGTFNGGDCTPSLCPPPPAKER